MLRNVYSSLLKRERERAQNTHTDTHTERQREKQKRERGVLRRIVNARVILYFRERERENWKILKERSSAHVIVIIKEDGGDQPHVQNARVHQLPGASDHRGRQANRRSIFSVRSTHESRPGGFGGVSETSLLFEEEEEERRRRRQRRRRRATSPRVCFTERRRGHLGRGGRPADSREEDETGGCIRRRKYSGRGRRATGGERRAAAGDDAIFRWWSEVRAATTAAGDDDATAGISTRDGASVKEEEEIERVL